jgi:hypothetical protein
VKVQKIRKFVLLGFARFSISLDCSLGKSDGVFVGSRPRRHETDHANQRQRALEKRIVELEGMIESFRLNVTNATSAELPAGRSLSGVQDSEILNEIA